MIVSSLPAHNVGRKTLIRHGSTDRGQATHTQHLHDMHGVDLVVSFLGSIVAWPVLLFANVCMT
jgi:hypothetical protein